MLLNEFLNDEVGYRTEKDDNSVLKLHDLRKTRLTLGQLNRLRIAHDVRKFEHETKLETITTQYAPPAEPAAGGGLGM